MTLVFNHINCLAYIYNNKIIINGSHEVMTDCPSFITSPPCLSYLVDPSENILPKTLNMMKRKECVSPLTRHMTPYSSWAPLWCQYQCPLPTTWKNIINVIKSWKSEIYLILRWHAYFLLSIDNHKIRKQLGLGNLMSILIAPNSLDFLMLIRS